MCCEFTEPTSARNKLTWDGRYTSSRFQFALFAIPGNRSKRLFFDREGFSCSKKDYAHDLAFRQKINGYNQVVIPRLKYAISCIIYGTGKFGITRKIAKAFDEVGFASCWQNHGCDLATAAYQGSMLSRKRGTRLESSRGGSGTLCGVYIMLPLLKAGISRIATVCAKAYEAAPENRLKNDFERLAQACIQIKDRTFATPSEAARAISALVHERYT
ncbi:hypothetical protein COOONC_06597 [Cooperia oncophora]